MRGRGDGAILQELRSIHEKLNGIMCHLGMLTHDVSQLTTEVHTMSQQLDTLTAQVKANTDAEDSAVLLIQGIAAQLAAAKTDPVAIQALSDKLKSSADALAAAVVANSPAA